MKPFLNTKQQRILRIFALFLSTFYFSSAFAQSLNQGISGQVIDTESKQAICGVELIIKNSDPVITTVTNEAGYFQFENIPQGRFYVQASYADYKCQPISKVDIFPGKSKVLCIELASNEYQKRNKSNLKTKIKELITGLP